MNNNRPSVDGKPGAAFAFKPRANLSSRELPSFSKTHRDSKTGIDAGPLREIGAMVNERAPPKAPLQSLENIEKPAESQLGRERSPTTTMLRP
ncbi:hypothetical protein ACCO45_009177 [Purpureocillium lilacinum]|uniref:Uncharacterized protein n=1 Tax=Purpureocillium lilacinum TaxID=33203 RepID=A0ACC4DJ63_PURLI